MVSVNHASSNFRFLNSNSVTESTLLWIAKKIEPVSNWFPFFFISWVWRATLFAFSFIFRLLNVFKPPCKCSNLIESTNQTKRRFFLIREKLFCSRSVSKRVLEPEERTNDNNQNLVSKRRTEPFGRRPRVWSCSARYACPSISVPRQTKYIQEVLRWLYDDQPVRKNWNWDSNLDMLDIWFRLFSDIVFNCLFIVLYMYKIFQLKQPWRTNIF